MIKLKDISFENCPCRLKDGIYKNIGYCSLNQHSCDIYIDNNPSDQCPLFEKVD